MYYKTIPHAVVPTVGLWMHGLASKFRPLAVSGSAGKWWGGQADVMRVLEVFNFTEK